MNRHKNAILEMVMKMKGSKDLLSSILKTTQMGQVGIRAVMEHAVRPGIKQELKSQLAEYDNIEREAHSIASSRGWELEELDPMVKYMAGMMSRMQLVSGSVDSKIAAMMIQGNTKGMIKSLKNMHRYYGDDVPVSTLSQKLLDCETANIRQMQGYV